MLWLYLHFPQLLLDQVRRSQPMDHALVIADGAGQKVLQACPQAQDQGIQPGMRLKTALGLAPELRLLQADPQQQSQLLEEQARWLYRYVAHLTPASPDGLWAEVSSLQRLYGGLPAIWQTVEQALAEHQLTAWAALGHTPLAARLLARAGKGECSADKNHIHQALAQLPLSDAELDATTCTRLNRLGLQTLGDVFTLPPKELARRLSPELLATLQKIQGTRPDPKAPWQPPHRFQKRADFIQEVEHSQGLVFALQRILAELEDDLCWRQQDTDTLLLILHHRHQEPTRLRLRTTGPEAPGGQDLLGDTQDLNEAWHTLISRLQARLGEQALSQLSPQADHRPEHAWSASALSRAPHSEPVEPSLLPRRPLWLLSGPSPLTEPPVAWFSGPERISGGWWDGQRVHRDYYIAQLSGGQLAWVFRDTQNAWFVHGWFG